MKTLATIFLLLTLPLVWSQNVELLTVQGESLKIETKSGSITNKGIKTSDGLVIPYSVINKASTSDFEIFEKLMNKTSKRAYQHVEIVFTGDENAYAVRLEKLRRNRTGANVATATGGVMTVLGILSGDRGLMAAGVATTAAGSVAKSVNDDRTSKTQSAMLNDMDQRASEPETAIEEKVESDEEWMRQEFGKENVDGLIELVDGNHEKALAYANVGELSKDANHRLSAMWLKAMIEKDRGNKDEAEAQYERLITFDPEIVDAKDAEKEVDLLLKEVEDIRKQE